MITLKMVRNLMIAAAMLIVLAITMGYQHVPRAPAVAAVVNTR